MDVVTAAMAINEYGHKILAIPVVDLAFDMLFSKVICFFWAEGFSGLV